MVDQDKQITLKQYFGPYHGTASVTNEIMVAATGLLVNVNKLVEMAIEDGVDIQINPATGSIISGNGNGGHRPLDCPIGAAASKHKRGHGVDIYDPRAHFAAWCYKNRVKMRQLGLCMERHEWTPTWCHLQDIPPGPPGSPWRIDFIPDSTPAKCRPLMEQMQ